MQSKPRDDTNKIQKNNNDDYTDDNCNNHTKTPIASTGTSPLTLPTTTHDLNPTTMLSSRRTTPNKNNPLCLFGPLCLLLVAFPQLVLADCLVGDIVYSQGQSIGHLGVECLNGTSYQARESSCGPNGTVLETTSELSCGGSVPYCVQCGPASPGNALCLSTPTPPARCQSSIGTEGCLVEDFIVRPGQSFRLVGIQCLNETTFLAEETTCVGNNTLKTERFDRTCPSAESRCLQCGEAVAGSVTCVSDPDKTCDTSDAVPFLTVSTLSTLLFGAVVGCSISIMTEWM